MVLGWYWKLMGWSWDGPVPAPEMVMGWFWTIIGWSWDGSEIGPNGAGMVLGCFWGMCLGWSWDSPGMTMGWFG